MVVKRVKTNACGAKVNLQLLQEAKNKDTKNKVNTKPLKRGERHER